MFEKKSSYSKEELIACGEGKLFDEGGPRLPSPPMLMFDRFTEINETGGKYGKGLMIGELDIKEDLWFFDCHFKTDPVMPGCLGLDALWQMTGFFLGWNGAKGKGRALGAGQIKFTDQILPNAEMITYKVDFKRVKIGKLVMAISDGEVLCNNKTLYRCEDLKVGVFQE